MNKIDNNLIMKTASQIIYGYFRNHELSQDEAFQFMKRTFESLRTEAKTLDNLTDAEKDKPTLKTRKKVKFNNEG